MCDIVTTTPRRDSCPAERVVPRAGALGSLGHDRRAYPGGPAHLGAAPVAATDEAVTIAPVLLVAEDEAFAAHDPGPGHPERVARLEAVAGGVRVAGLDDAVVVLEPRDARREELERVHTPALLEHLDAASKAGGGSLDPDTVVSRGSWDAAVRAAGAGLAAADALTRDEGDAAFLALRPPGHHATPRRAMGFCLVNNVAVTAAALVERGDCVAILDYDAHHGNGTQEIFWSDPRVLYVSLHQWPLYPGTGRLDETGAEEATGTTCNVPLPAGATGDVYLRAFDELIEPAVSRFAPDWVLLSAGFDAHRADPLTGLALTAGDFARLAARALALTPRRGRLIAFLEGGYDLQALTDSVAATLPSMLGGAPASDEPPSSGGPGAVQVEAAVDAWHRRFG
jgi:acetoin utilization deacetylase AcuC-like enzyme